MTAIKETLYSKAFTCPVCEGTFTSKKVRTSAIRTLSREADFYTVYVGENPTWYEIAVCPNCGYSAFEAGYHDLTIAQKALLKKTIKPRWKQRDYGDERTLSEAIETHMLAMACYQVIAAKKTTLGKLCLRMAWLYRSQNDEKEMVYLESAVRNLEEGYTTERLDENKSNELNIMYLLGELNRRIGRHTEASRWFSMVLAEPEVKKIRHIELKAREQMSQNREEYRSAKEEVQ